MKFNDYAGSKIRSIRKRKKIRTSELAKVCGVSESEMRHLENGTRLITDAQIERVAEWLQVSPAALRSRNIVDYSDIMHILFEFGLYSIIEPVVNEEGTFLKVNDPSLVASIQAWMEKKDEVQSGKLTKGDLESWQDHFPDSMPGHSEPKPYTPPLPDPSDVVGVHLITKEYTPEEMLRQMEEGLVQDAVIDDDE
ncbi:MAG: helix-turn-helix domain-containing protein [Oscillospiraceae bacterium]|nr:helix-turn-helix domain-containing protein [Oscillospiraceae bacterium]